MLRRRADHPIEFPSIARLDELVREDERTCPIAPDDIDLPSAVSDTRRAEIVMIKWVLTTRHQVVTSGRTPHTRSLSLLNERRSDIPLAAKAEHAARRFSPVKAGNVSHPRIHDLPRPHA